MSSVSALGASPTMLQAMQRIRGELNAAQTEAATGRRADIGLTLGGATAKTIDLRRLVSVNEAYRASGENLDAQWQAMQSAVGALTKSAASVRDDALAAINGADPTLIAAGAQAALQDAFAKVNTRVGARYVFGGEKSDTPPMGDSGVQGKAAIQAAFTATFGFSPGATGAAGISGAAMTNFLETQFSALFQPSSWASDWTQASTQPQQAAIAPDQQVATPMSAHDSGLRTLAQGLSMLADLGLSSLSADARTSVLTHAASALGASADQLTAGAARLGLVQRQASEAREALASQSAALQSQIGTLENVDPAEAATRVSQLTTQLETSYALTARLSKLSLLNFL